MASKKPPAPKKAPSRVATKSVPSKASVRKVAPARAKAPSKYQSALANPQMNSATRKVGIRPYSAEWKKEVARKNKAYDKSWRKKAGFIAETFTPIGAGDAVYRAIKGRDAKTGKKYNRLTAGADAAFMLGTFGAGKAAKATKKAVSTAKTGRLVASQINKDISGAKHVAMDIPISSYRAMAKKDAKALAVRKTKVATARQAAKGKAVAKKNVMKKVKKVK